MKGRERGEGKGEGVKGRERGGRERSGRELMGEGRGVKVD